MKKTALHSLINFLIALVWIVNGFYCKILNQVPRHQDIVAKILSDSNARVLTFLIGIAELIMSAWIISKWKPKLNAMTQITVIICMNILEFALAPDLLLWGRFNIVFAFLFSIVIYLNTFVFPPKKLI